MTGRSKRKISGWGRFFIAIAVIAFIAAVVLSTMFIGLAAADASIKVWTPDYAMIDLDEILNKQELDEEDYATLYAQTGLGKIGVDRLMESGNKSRIKTIQKDFFAGGTIISEKFGAFLCHEYIDKKVATVPTRTGDVLITSSTHFSFYRSGHCGIAVDDRGSILQAASYEEPSGICSVDDFDNRVNFLILSPKVDEETKEQVAEYATENLVGLEYGLTVGVLSKKFPDKPKKTHCAHIVWYAYKKFGVDLDANGGMVVSPKNLANSPYMEVVQVFGFDPQKLWK